MVQLSKPSKELVARLMKKVDYQKQLKGVIMNAMAGTIERSIYSFQDACNFLYSSSLEELQAAGGAGSIRYIDFGVLQKWLREVFGDEELATAIGQEVATEAFYGKQLPLVKKLLMQRLNQCLELTQVTHS